MIIYFQQEIKTVIGDRKKPTLADRDKLPYTEATITEIMRVAPTALGSLPHYTITDTEIAGYKIPKGTEVGMNLFESNYNIKLFNLIFCGNITLTVYMLQIDILLPLDCVILVVHNVYLQIHALFVSAAWNPSLFPDPYSLKPERHLNEDGKFVRNDCLSPFGTGRFHSYEKSFPITTYSS